MKITTTLPKLKYRQTHLPSGKVFVKDFTPYQYVAFRLTDFEDLVETWNKRSVVNGEKMWHHELVAVWRENESK